MNDESIIHQIAKSFAKKEEELILNFFGSYKAAEKYGKLFYISHEESSIELRSDSLYPTEYQFDSTLRIQMRNTKEIGELGLSSLYWEFLTGNELF